jgi:MFS family permease
MLCAGPSLPVLIAGRALQGLSAAIVWTVGLALLSDTTKRGKLGEVMGCIATSTSPGSLAGPLLGGILMEMRAIMLSSRWDSQSLV